MSDQEYTDRQKRIFRDFAGTIRKRTQLQLDYYALPWYKRLFTRRPR